MEEKMATSASGLLVQHSLGDKFPDVWRPTIARSVELTCKINSNGDPEFLYSERIFPFISPQDLVPENIMLGIPRISSQLTRLLDLGVWSDCFINIRLDDSMAWRWSTDYDAITTKDDFREYYFYLRYLKDEKDYARPDFPKGETCKQISFGAKWDSDGPKGQTHGFSLNLEIGYEDGTYLPITIDPDLRNPSQ
jgi:hypothetical protein